MNNMILTYSMLSFVIGLYVAFGVWAAVTVSSELLAIILFPMVMIFLLWLRVTFIFNSKFKWIKKDDQPEEDT